MLSWTKSPSCFPLIHEAGRKYTESMKPQGSRFVGPTFILFLVVSDRYVEKKRKYLLEVARQGIKLYSSFGQVVL